MNREEIMRQIMAARQEEKARGDSERGESSRREAQDYLLGTLADMLDGHADLLNRNTQSVRVKNQPKKMTVDGKVSLNESDVILGALEDLEQAFCDQVCAMKDELKASLEAHRTVSVDNLEIPKPPEPLSHVTASVDSLPKYVGEKLEELKKAVKGLDLKVTLPPPQVTQVPADLTPLETRLERLEGVLQRLLDKEVVEVEKPDFTTLEGRLDALLPVLELVAENTGVQTSQTFASSWQKSLHMQSLDGATTTVWKTVGSTRVIDYLEFTDREGRKWRKTYSYDPATAEVNSWTAWTAS